MMFNDDDDDDDDDGMLLSVLQSIIFVDDQFNVLQSTAHHGHKHRYYCFLILGRYDPEGILNYYFLLLKIWPTSTKPQAWKLN